MPARDWKARLQDIVEAIGKIDRYTRGMTSDAFRADEKTIDAVVRNLVVIGEASRQASRGRIFTLDVVELVRFDAARAERRPIPEPRYRPAIHQLS
jgi:uncharacterized protein with HEPN domain